MMSYKLPHMPHVLPTELNSPVHIHTHKHITPIRDNIRAANV